MMVKDKRNKVINILNTPAISLEQERRDAGIINGIK
jgi:hypothetical protein